jgi:hypothetical protein
MDMNPHGENILNLYGSSSSSSNSGNNNNDG